MNKEREHFLNNHVKVKKSEEFENWDFIFHWVINT